MWGKSLFCTIYKCKVEESMSAFLEKNDLNQGDNENTIDKIYSFLCKNLLLCARNAEKEFLQINKKN